MRSWLGRIVAVAGVAGCNAIVGIGDPIDGDPNAPSGVTASDVDAFVGRWESESPPTSDRLKSCGLQTSNVSFNGKYVFLIRSVANGKVVGTNAANTACQLTLTVSGKTATFSEAPRCNFDGLSVDYTSATLSLSGPGVGRFELLGKASVGGDVCEYEGQFVLKRTGP